MIQLLAAGVASALGGMDPERRRRLLLAVGVALLTAGLLGLYGCQERRIETLRTALAAEQRDRAAEKAAAGEAAIHAHLAARDTEDKWAAQASAAKDAYARDLQARARRDGALSAGRLRFDPAQLGPAAGSAATPAEQACYRAAATLRELLGEADRLAEDSARAADRHADEVRLCLDAWPTDVRLPGAGRGPVALPATTLGPGLRRGDSSSTTTTTTE